MASSSAPQETTGQPTSSGWGPPPEPIPFSELAPIDNTPIPPACPDEVSYDNTRKMTAFKWEHGFWPNKKAQLAWRVNQWHDQVKVLVHTNYQWYALVDKMYRELEVLERNNEIHCTPITMRQFLLLQCSRAELLQELRDCAEHYPKNIVITRRMSTPPRNVMLEFIEKQVSAGENDRTAKCARKFVERYGNI